MTPGVLEAIIWASAGCFVAVVFAVVAVIYMKE